jgi:antitoxin component of MazEF toxin-antitoxin module
MPLETKRKLIKFSNYSFCLTLPKSAIEQLGWGKGEEVNVVFDEQKQLITISKTSKGAPPTANATRQPTAQKPAEKPKLRW